MTNGTIRRFPLADIDVSTPFYSGKLEVLCADSPVYDLIIGNVSGAREPRDPDKSWVSPDDLQACRSDDGAVQQQEVQAVETRAAVARRKAPTRQLKVPDVVDVSREDFLNAQKEDQSVCHLWEKAEQKQEPPQGKYVFFVKNECLRRRRADGSSKNSQVVVPKLYRHDVMHGRPSRGW